MTAATVPSIDHATPMVTLDASDHPRVLSSLTVGETYDIGYTESLAIAVHQGAEVNVRS